MPSCGEDCNSQFHRFIDQRGKSQQTLLPVTITDNVVWIFIAAWSSPSRIFVSIRTLPLPMIIPRLNLRDSLPQHAVKLTIHSFIASSNSEEKPSRLYHPLPSQTMWCGFTLQPDPLPRIFVSIRTPASPPYDYSSVKLERLSNATCDKAHNSQFDHFIE